MNLVTEFGSPVCVFVCVRVCVTLSGNRGGVNRLQDVQITES